MGSKKMLQTSSVTENRHTSLVLDNDYVNPLLEGLSKQVAEEKFISMNERFLHSFMEWVNTQDGVEASTIKDIEDEILDFLMEKANQ